MAGLADRIDEGIVASAEALLACVGRPALCINAAAGDALCVLLLEMSGYSKDEFGATHPGGAVGKKLEQEGTQ